jgi:putative flippase GtrA
VSVLMNKAPLLRRLDDRQGCETASLDIPAGCDAAAGSPLKGRCFGYRFARRVCNVPTTNMRGISIMVRAAAIDVSEFARFVVSGIAATVGNMLTVWLARRFLSFEAALLPGIAISITISFALSKLFAFRSRSWKRTAGELARFLTVYATGCAIYWMVAVSIRIFFLAHGLTAKAAEPGGVLVGGSTMMVTSYCGHRFFTYRTYQRQKGSDNRL